MLKVNEIFQSLQGESTFSGLPCVFVRLTGCNLRCSYCDTTYAYEEGALLAPETVVERVLSYSCDLVEITGGEPLLQSETSDLARMLLNEKFTVLVETNGSMDIGPLPEGVIRIVDIKCPGSGCAETNDWNNLEQLRPKDQVKWVISDRADFDWAVGRVLRHGLCGKCSVLFSPAADRLAPDLLAEWILEKRLGIRLQLQLHKAIWPLSSKGR